jgi:hypothetical protein
MAQAEWMRTKPGDVVYVKVACGEVNTSHIAKAVFAALGAWYPAGRDMSEVRRQMEEFFRRRMVILDEAQNMKQRHKESHTLGASFDWVVVAAEDGGFPLILCGNLSLPSIRDRHPSLDGRVRRSLVIKAPTRGDVAAVAAAWSVTGAAETHRLAAVAVRTGGLRRLDTVLAEAGMDADRRPITPAFVKATVRRLGFRAEAKRWNSSRSSPTSMGRRGPLAGPLAFSASLPLGTARPLSESPETLIECCST